MMSRAATLKLLQQEKEDLVQEKEELVQEKEELVQEKEELVQKKEELVQDKQELVWEKQDLVQEKENLVQEKEELVQEKEDLVQEKEDLVQEKEELVQEKEELVKEKGRQSHTIDRLRREWNDLQSEKYGWQREKEKLQGDNIQLKRSLEDVSKDTNKRKKLMNELEERVVCPVCLVAPREGPVPCCPSGHITCSPCLEKWRRKGKTTCITCRGPMGEGRSLLAKVVIEHMEHRCGLRGCKEMVQYEEMAKHEEACRYRQVACPGICRKLVAFCEVVDHAWSCKGLLHWQQPQNMLLWKIKRSTIEEGKRAKYSARFVSHSKHFYFRLTSSSSHLTLEVVMMGRKEECDQFVAEISVVNPETRRRVLTSCHSPRPISSTNTPALCLTIAQTSLPKIWRLSKSERSYEFGVSVQIRAV